MTPMAEDNIAVIRHLLSTAFTSDDFADFCLDHFREVYWSFTGSQTQPERVRLLIEYVLTRGLVSDLLDKIRAARPDLNAKLDSHLVADAPPMPASTSPGPSFPITPVLP